jgi:hypothetical protein
VRQLDTQNCRLQRVEAEIAADTLVVVALLSAVIPQQADFVAVTRPPSPNAPRFLVGKNEKQLTRPIVPACRPSSVAPIAWQASSINGTPVSREIASSGSMSAHKPYKCTGMIAFVRGVTAARTALGDRL